MYTKPWTLADEDLLRALIAEGLSATQIGLRLHRTRNSIIGHCHRNKIPLLRKRGSRTLKSEPKKRNKPVRPAIAVAPRAKEAVEGIPSYLKSKLGPMELTQLVGLDVVGVPLMELERHHCRWALEGNGSATLFCGRPTGEGHAYCDEHAELAYNDAPLKRL